MKKLRICLLAAVMTLLCMGTACAEMYIGQRPPESWADRETLCIRSIDVDRNDAMLITCGGEAMLVDAATNYFIDRLNQTLDAEGVTALKYLFSTHSDDDHIGGFAPLIAQGRYSLGTFLSPNSMSYQDPAGFHQMVMNQVQARKVDYREVEDMEVLTLGGARMEVLRCLKPWGRNARSACLNIVFGQRRILLTGDVDAMAMEHFVEKYRPEQLQADIMKVPHHGIITIPVSFLTEVAPEFMFVTNNAAGLDKFRTYMEKVTPGIPMLYSGDGAVVMETDGQDWYVWQEENW